MKGKPIEPGCLALIVGLQQEHENNGRIVRVVRSYRGDYTPPGVPAGISLGKNYDRQALRWVVAVEGSTPPLVWVTRDSETGARRRTFYVRERGHQAKFLIRIDDGEQPQEETTTRERELTLSGEAA